MHLLDSKEIIYSLQYMIIYKCIIVIETVIIEFTELLNNNTNMFETSSHL
jgi:hypothetical protein